MNRPGGYWVMNEVLHSELPAEFRRRAEAVLPGRVSKIMLFGSRARGDSRADSDWDFAVFLTGPFSAADQWALADAAYEMMMEMGGEPFIQPIAFRAERENEDTLLMRNIRNEGRRI